MGMFEDAVQRANERAAQLVEHRASCSLETCERCERAPCPSCGKPSAMPPGWVTGQRCEPCGEKRARSKRMRPALMSLPGKHIDTTLAGAWLAKLVGGQTIVDATTLDPHTRMVFIGPPGSGKTSLAIAMFRMHIERLADEAIEEVRSRFVSAHALAKARTQHPLGEGEAPLVRAALDAPILLLDELGGEDARHASAVAEVLYERDAEDLTTWVTTGVKATEIANRYGGGIARRVFENAKVWQLGSKR